MPCHSEIGQSKSLFLLTVALLCFQAKKLPFSHGNGHSDWLTERCSEYFPYQDLPARQTQFNEKKTSQFKSAISK